MTRYWLGPWEWDAADVNRPFWKAPAQSAVGVDLRSVPQCAGAIVPSGFGLFVTANAVNLGSSYENLGTDPTQAWNSQSKARWQSALGIPNALTGTNLRQILWETLTVQADPIGDSRALPLVPAARRYEIWLEGQLIDTKDFRLADAEATPLIDLLKRIYRQVRQDSLDGKHIDKTGAVDLLKYRRILGHWVRKYRVDYRNFQPADLPDEPPLTPETTLSDDYNRANSATLGSSSEGWSWTEVAGNTDIFSNQAQGQTNGSRNRADSDLSSADHYTQVTMVNNSGSGQGCGPGVRFASAADTVYTFISDGSRIFKVVAGAQTALTSGIADPANGSVMKLQVSGSSLTGYDDGVNTASVTDTAIAGGTRGGLYIDAGATKSLADNWSAADLAAVASPASILGAGIGSGACFLGA